jgi:Ca2+-binding RTX toxin-like protein
LLGGSGNDRLIGREGDDVLIGGVGDDTYYVDSMADQIVELAGEGWDTVFSTGSYIAHDNVDGVYLDGTQSINATGNALNNYLSGNAGDNVLDGGMGDDALNGGSGLDTLIGGFGNDRLLGGAGADVLRGGDGSDQLSGEAGDDMIHGGAGSDRLEGGAGNDTFLFNADDFVNLTGGPDNIVDFRGAGTSGTGEQDVLMLSGFGPGATLVFDHYGYTNSVQYYRIVDPGNPGVEHMILVQTAGTTNLLSSSDYLFS